MSAHLYSLRGLTQTKNGRTILDIDSLDIEAGDACALLGDNGAGKSTLMKILAFLERPTAGKIHFMGREVTAAAGARLRSRVVWVPQFPVMFTGSVLSNVAYPLRLRGVSAHRRLSRSRNLLDMVGLGHLADAPARRLSGGEAQRVSTARALAAGAEVLLFDEPTANVDSRSRGELLALMRRLHMEQGLSLLVATHDGELAAALCRRQIHLENGRPAHRHVLPGGGAALSGVLRPLSGNSSLGVVRFVLSCASGHAPENARLCGVRELEAGTALWLRLANGAPLHVLLTDQEDRRHAGTLRLDEELRVESGP